LYGTVQNLLVSQWTVYALLLKFNKIIFSKNNISPWSTILLEKIEGFLLIKKFPAFYGTQRFIIKNYSVNSPIARARNIL